MYNSSPPLKAGGATLGGSGWDERLHVGFSHCIRDPGGKMDFLLGSFPGHFSFFLFLKTWFIKKNVFNFWLFWVFIAARWLSLVMVNKLLIAVASRYRAWSLGCLGSIVMAYRLSCPMACGLFPDPGIEPVFPALAGGFLTTEPPGKALAIFPILFMPPCKSWW